MANRPQLGNNAAIRLGVRVPPEQAEVWYRAAKARGLTISEFLREAAEKLASIEREEVSAA